MLTAHIPASYLLTRKLQKRYKTKKYLCLGILAGIFPDLDLIWFYFIDNRAYLHHSYWVHIPFYWLIFLAVSIVAYFTYFKRYAHSKFIIILIFSNWLLHLLLDSFVGEIKWLYPFSPQRFALFEVTARYDWWLWSFVFHWSFLLELAIIAVALIVFLKDFSKNQNLPSFGKKFTKHDVVK